MKREVIIIFLWNENIVVLDLSEIMTLLTSLVIKIVTFTRRVICLLRNNSHRLTLYHTITTFNDPVSETFRKHCGKRRKCW